MRNLLGLAILVLTQICAAPALATTASDLISRCEKSTGYEDFCHAYIQAVLDDYHDSQFAAGAFVLREKLEKPWACVPIQVTPDDVRKIMLGLSGASIWNAELASGVVAIQNTLARAFPCPPDWRERWLVY